MKRLRKRSQRAIDAAAPVPQPLSGAPHRGGWAISSLVLLTLLVFSPVLTFPLLHWDDTVFIVDNPAYHPPTISSLARYWIELRPSVQFYVPFMQSIWWALAAVFGRFGADGVYQLPALPFHAANWIAHAAATAIVYAIIRRIVRMPAAAWVGAAVFALHPIQVEAVAWASTFYTTLSGALVLAAVWQLGRYLDLRYGDPAAPLATPAGDAHPGWRGGWALLAGTVCFALALLSKPSAVVAPMLALLIEAGLRHRPWRQLAGPIVLWVVLAVPVSLVAKLAQPAPPAYWPLWQRPFLVADALTFYAGRVLVPFLAYVPDYGRSPDWLAADGSWRFTWLPPLAAAAALAVLAFRRRMVWPAICAALFAAAMLPNLGLVPFEFQRYSTVADRYAYLAMFGIGLAAAIGLASFSGASSATRRARTLSAGIAACGILLLLGLSLWQLRYWRDERTLFRHTLAVAPDSLAAHLVLGRIALDAGDPSTAVELLRQALETHPDDPGVLTVFGDFSFDLGRFDDAIPFYERAVARSAVSPVTLARLGVALLHAGRRAEAVAAFQRAIATEPNYAQAHLELGAYQLESGDPAAARAQFNEVLRIHPYNLAARQALARVGDAGKPPSSGHVSP